MNAKHLILILCLFFNAVCFSQIKDTSICDKGNNQIDTTIIAFIKSKQGKKNIKWKFFHKKFELNLSDPSFDIVKFMITWDDRRRDLIIARINIGKMVLPDLENSDLPNMHNYSLKNIAPGTLITFEHIVAWKDGICYRIRPFLIYTTL